MQLWAAIDIMEGSVVTLVQGRASEKTVWKEDPLTIAERWQGDGADGLHLIDLDAAFQKGSNREIMLRIIKRASVPVEVGGGMRSKGIVDLWLKEGIERVVVGTIAYKEPATLKEILQVHGPEKIVVAADYRNGTIVTKGWTENQGIPLLEAVHEMQRNGVMNLLATSVGRDGMASGPDVETIATICNSGMKVIASGGIRNAEDLDRLSQAGAEGAILGRALYEGTVSLSAYRRGN